MALKLYTTPSIDDEITSLNPFRFTFDGIKGGAIIKPVYLKNDDVTKWYANVTLSVVDTVGADITDGSIDSFSWRLIQQSYRPSIEQWERISPGNTVSVSSAIGNSSVADIVTFYPVWIRVEIPENYPLSTITDVQLYIAGTEHLI